MLSPNPVSRPCRTVLALGGNALIRRGQECTWNMQATNMRHCVRAMHQAGVLNPDRPEQYVLTHGNGPQVGDFSKHMSQEPLHELVACTQASVGHLMEQELRRWLPPLNPDAGGYDPEQADRLRVCTVVTHVGVHRDDPAFLNPTKFVGITMNREQSKSVPKEWTVKKDGEAWRRVVPSPKPMSILQLPTIRKLLDPRSPNKTMVICCGGGGVPMDLVTNDPVDAVVDKDRTSALLAKRLHAHRLIILTDVHRVWVSEESARKALTDGDDPNKTADDVSLEISEFSKHKLHLRRISVDRLRALNELNEFPEGSMKPKIEAIIDFLSPSDGDDKHLSAEYGDHGVQDRCAVIGALDDLPEILEGRSGTYVFTSEHPELRQPVVQVRGPPRDQATKKYSLL